MPVNLRLFHSGVGDMANLFNKKYEDHKNSQLENPFSEWEGAGLNKRRLSREDADYGRPKEGSLSERRSQAAQQHLLQETKFLLENIWDCAQWKHPDGRAAITFGKLFNLYSGISDKVVGTLLRARRHGYLHFEGEMLYQRRDEDKVIELNRNINTIRARFGQPPVPNGGDVEPWGEIEETPPGSSNTTPGSSRRGSFCRSRRNSSQEEIEQKDDIGSGSSVAAETSQGCKSKSSAKENNTEEPKENSDRLAAVDLPPCPQIAVNDQIISGDFSEDGLASTECSDISRIQEAPLEMSNESGGAQLAENKTGAEIDKEASADEERLNSGNSRPQETNMDQKDTNSREDASTKGIPRNNELLKIDGGIGHVSADTSDYEDTSSESDQSEVKLVPSKDDSSVTNKGEVSNSSKDLSKREGDSESESEEGSRLGSKAQEITGEVDRSNNNLDFNKKPVNTSSGSGNVSSGVDSDDGEETDSESENETAKKTLTKAGEERPTQSVQKIQNSHVLSIRKPADDSTSSEESDSEDESESESESE